MVSDGNGWYVQAQDKDGQTVVQSGKAFASRKFYSKGVWFTPDPVKEERWKNRTYKDFCENLDRWDINKDELLMNSIIKSLSLTVNNL